MPCHIHYSTSVVEMAKTYESKAEDLQKHHQERLGSVQSLEEERKKDFKAYCSSLKQSRDSEYSATTEVLGTNKDLLSKQWEVISGVPGKMTEVKDLVTTTLEDFKYELTASLTSGTFGPIRTGGSYSEVAGKLTGSDKGNFSIFIDLPKGDQSALSASIDKDNVCCNGIYECRKGAKISVPYIREIHKIKSIISSTPSLQSLKTYIPQRENPKIIIKFTQINDEKEQKDQLLLKNPIFLKSDFKILFKIKLVPNSIG
ncbi:hypothetical protein JTE90_006755 [Oedothorax gibbosus]|uniref:Uncharacterized protein n=1 Tax=Oedothorax gibbosus TaxID=931172 RepID=A0AAV6UJR2_9ARAC|nr:hypothetical protein JTE90_006755 [Oedothorax gibbosus]